MRNPVDVKFPDERVAKIVADRLAQAPFDIVPVGCENPIYPSILIRHAADNLQSNHLIVADRSENPYRLDNYKKREVPDPEKYWKWNLGNGFSLQYLPREDEHGTYARSFLQLRFEKGVLPVRSPYFWFPSNIAIEELFEVGEPKKEIELGALAKIVPTVRQRTRKIAV